MQKVVRFWFSLMACVSLAVYFIGRFTSDVSETKTDFKQFPNRSHMQTSFANHIIDPLLQLLHLPIQSGDVG